MSLPSFKFSSTSLPFYSSPCLPIQFILLLICHLILCILIILPSPLPNYLPQPSDCPPFLTPPAIPLHYSQYPSRSPNYFPKPPPPLDLDHTLPHLPSIFIILPSYFFNFPLPFLFYYLPPSASLLMLPSLSFHSFPSFLLAHSFILSFLSPLSHYPPHYPSPCPCTYVLIHMTLNFLSPSIFLVLALLYPFNPSCSPY